MSNLIRVMVFIAFLAVQPLLTQAVPVDVDGDRIVGPHEIIDLAENWKGDALQEGGLQPWQIDGATIFYNTGKVGIGSATPHHQLRISGGPFWTSHQWIGSLELDNAAAIGWQANAGGQRFGIGQTGGGLYFFHSESDPGTEASEPNYAMTITDTGSVGIGVLNPTSKLEIAGQDGLAVTGFQPFLTLRDSNASNARGVIQSANGHLHFYPNSFIGTSPAMTILTGGGSVGIGTDTPSGGQKLHVVSTAGSAILGNAPSGNGVVGRNALSGNAATAGINSAQDGVGILGQASLGSSSIGVWGSSESGLGTLGASNINVGVKGTSTSSIGVQGVSASSSGVEGRSGSGDGVYGYSDSSNGVSGYSAAGTGVRGVGSTGIYAEATSSSGIGISAAGFGGGQAGSFSGKVGVYGELFVLGEIVNPVKSTLRLDHPLDPANKYLSHTSVESPDLKNIYDGNVITDATGNAEVLLPDYFEALNKDFRYQLTVIGDFSQAVVSKEIENNAFEVKTDKANVKVSWMVTGIRQDAYAKAHPTVVEKAKSEAERGKYLTPEVFGQPKEMGIHFRPEMDLQSRTVLKVE